MSLTYRAIWEDPWPSIRAQADVEFRSWLSQKHGVTFDGVEYASATLEVRINTASENGVDALEATVVEKIQDEVTLTMRVLTGPDKPSWVWVDVTRVTANYFEWTPIHAPRIVRSLLHASLRSGHTPSSGGVALSDRALPVGPAQVELLHDIIVQKNRGLPVVVFSHRPGDGHQVQRADRAAEILAGVARVFVLTGDATDPFRDAIGVDLAVWGGALRVYLPGSLSASRHRYIPWDQFNLDDSMAGSRVSSLLGPYITARPAPAEYKQVRAALARSGGKDLDELLAEIDEENQVLRSKLEAEQEEKLNLQADVEDLATELTMAQRNFAIIDRAKEGAPASDLDGLDPADISSLQEAVHLARRHLSPALSIPDSATEHLGECDESLSSPAWGRTAWRALRALHSYAESHFDGDFWQYCSEGRGGWSATSKKLAMRESETVMANTKLRGQRTFRVMRAGRDAPSFEVMQSHIKIAEGGGVLAPRIYFLVEEAEGGRIVHIGYVGPHRYVENTRTN